MFSRYFQFLKNDLIANYNQLYNCIVNAEQLTPRCIEGQAVANEG